jgi:predicted transposase YbfD/YdcC
MKYSATGPEVTLPRQGCVFDVGSLYAHFQHLQDRRQARGKRYALELVLTLIVLAKLSGEDRLYGIAEWARARTDSLCAALGVGRGDLPCHNTYRRVLRQAVDPDRLQAAASHFLTQSPQTGRSLLVAIDGKTLRGSIPTAESQAVHLLAAYLPEEGVVLMQVAVASQDNEITAAPRLLRSLDLRGKVVMGDAMHTQSKLSAQILDQEGDYVWLAKDNQRALRQDIMDLFTPEVRTPGFSAPPDDFETACTQDKAHGRLEERTLTTSSMLQDYADWPGLEQVFRLERCVTVLREGTVRREVMYGLTSLSRSQAGPRELLGLVRSYWGIENGLHYRRDRTLQEDATRTISPAVAQAMAIFNNLVIGLVARAGWGNLPQARRHYGAHLSHALNLVCHPPGLTM